MPMSLVNDSPSSCRETVVTSMITVAVISTTKAPQSPQASHHVQGRFTSGAPVRSHSGGVRRLHRLGDDASAGRVSSVARSICSRSRAPKRFERALRVVAAAVEAAVDEALHARAHRQEQRRHDERRRGDREVRAAGERREERLPDEHEPDVRRTEDHRQRRRRRASARSRDRCRRAGSGGSRSRRSRGNRHDAPARGRRRPPPTPTERRERRPFATTAATTGHDRPDATHFSCWRSSPRERRKRRTSDARPRRARSTRRMPPTCSTSSAERHELEPSMPERVVVPGRPALDRPGSKTNRKRGCDRARATVPSDDAPPRTTAALPSGKEQNRRSRSGRRRRRATRQLEDATRRRAAPGNVRASVDEPRTRRLDEAALTGDEDPDREEDPADGVARDAARDERADRRRKDLEGERSRAHRGIHGSAGSGVPRRIATTACTQHKRRAR